jgi:acylphosphatase
MEFVTIKRELAYRAYSGISFSPDQRADSTVKEFKESLEDDYDKLLTYAISNQQKEVLTNEFMTYQSQYKLKFEAYLYAKSRTMSTMITGPANFPVRSNEKKMNTERKRWDELSQWQIKAFRAVIRKIEDARTQEQKNEAIEQGLSKAMEYLLKESISVIQCIGGLSPYSPALLKSALERKIMNFAKNNPDLAIKIVAEINMMCQEKFKKDVFTSKHPILSKIEAIKAAIIKPIEIKETEVISDYEGITVINNHELQRIQILFPGKPSETIRNLLKSYAFKWAPSQSAWQRQNTSNGMYCTKMMLPKLQELMK